MGYPFHNYLKMVLLLGDLSFMNSEDTLFGMESAARIRAFRKKTE